MGTTLVTGAYGFIGSALARGLSKRGEVVIGVTRDWRVVSTKYGDLPDFTALGDVTDVNFVYRLLVKYDVGRIIHTAAHSAIVKCERDPFNAWRVNVLGTVAVLEAARRYNEKRPGAIESVVVAATDKVYGSVDPKDLPYTEDLPLRGIETYPATKVAADIAARSYAWTYGLPAKVIRSCNVYGPGDLEFTRLIPGSVKRILEGGKAVLYDSAENMVREFVYIDDEVDAYLAVLEHGEAGQAYNVSGTGPLRVGEFIRLLASLCGGEVEIRHSDLKEIPEQYMDSALLRQLGWSPKVPIREGLERTIAWYCWWMSVNSAAS